MVAGVHAEVDDELGRYVIGSTALSLELVRDDLGRLSLARVACGGGDWSPSPSPVLNVSLGSRALDELCELRGWASAEPSGEQALHITGQLGDTPVRVLLTLKAYPDSGVISWDTEIQNISDLPVAIGNPSSLQLTCRPTGDATLSVLRGGAYDDALPPKGYALQTLDRLSYSLSRPRVYASAGDGRSTGEFVPWFCLQGGGSGIMGALLWSGHWRMEARYTPAGARIALGLSNFEHLLAPGGALQLPRALLLGFSGDLDEAANALRVWELRYLAPPIPEDWPWVQYNHWYAYEGDIDEAKLLAEAEIAAQVGCEVFVIDDGWFAGRRPDSYVSGWGQWREDRSRFPSGLWGFGERIRQLGMRFGLWVEPERVDMQGEVAKEHPEWLAARDGVPITRRWGDEIAGHLCLGNPEVQDWMASEVVRVVREYGVQWLKWDYNMGYGAGCNREDHGHQAGDGHYAHTMGLYRVLATVRESCPGLIIENCASGGHRADLGMLAHSHIQWLSDYTHRAASCRQHVQGAGYYLPLQWLNAWVLEGADACELRSRMGGALGISARLGSWSQQQLELLARGIAEYKAVIRPLLSGHRYLLSSPWHEGWDVWQLCHPRSGEFTILAFRDSSAISSVRVAPRGISPEEDYILMNLDTGESFQMHGKGLLEISVARHASVLLIGKLVS